MPMKRGMACRVLALLPVLASIVRAAPVTFFHDIAPIVRRNCAPCHRPGEAAPFPLLTYEDVKRHARQIADVTKRRYMPPWLPEAGSGAFVEERRLSDAQIRLIDEWVNQGAPAGSPTSVATAPPATDPEWKLGKPDLELHVQQAYRLPADGPEIFWNFVIPVPVSIPRWVRAVEIRPGAPKVVHHASLLVDRAASARRQEAAPGAGFAGMDISINEATFDPDGVFLAWKPGSTPNVEPEGIAWRADPGMDLVFSVHLRPTGKPETVDPVIGLYFTDKPQKKFPMLVALERDASIEIPAGDSDYVITDSFRCPIDVDVLAVYPHAHYLGKRLEAYATLPDGSHRWLIRISDWDQNWQTVYRYREPVFLPKGTTISMRFHYDNSAANVRNPNHPPKRVEAGNRATDEMGHLWLQVLPRGAGDRRLELDEALMRHRLEKYPSDFRAHMILGALLLARADGGAATSMAEAAVRIQPKDAEAHNLLGSALTAVGRTPEAIAQFQQAVALRPEFVNARFNLAN